MESLIAVLIDVCMIFFFVRMFVAESERLHPVFGMVFSRRHRVVRRHFLRAYAASLYPRRALHVLTGDSRTLHFEK